MTTGMLLNRINEILEEESLKPAEIAGRVAAAMAVYNRELIQEFKDETDDLRSLIGENGRIIAELANIVKSADANQKSLEKLGADVSRIKSYNENHPSLLWLLRFKPKPTIAVIVFVSLLLIALSESGFIAAVSAFLGL